MQGLNDIDEKIIKKEYLIDLLTLIDEKDHLSFYGFYVRFIRYSISQIKVLTNIPQSLINIFNILFKVN